MNSKLLYTTFILAFLSCSTTKYPFEGYSSSTAQLLNNTTYKLSEISIDETYGYTTKNPINVGGIKKSEGVQNEQRFLNALKGPKGEIVTYHREGSCCIFKTKNGLFNKSGLLDIYMVTWKGSMDTVSLYINLYDFGLLKAPKGFTFKK